MVVLRWLMRIAAFYLVCMAVTLAVLIAMLVSVR